MMRQTQLHFNPSNMRVPLHIPMFGINHCDADYHNIRTISEITVIGYVLAGQGTIRVDNLSFLAQENDVFILPKGSHHEVTADPSTKEEWTYIWYNIRGNSSRLLETFRLQSTVHIPDTGIEHLFRKGFELMEQHDLDNEQLHIQLVLIGTEIMAHLANILEKRKSLLPVSVQEIKQYLDQIGTSKFDSSQMSKYFAMSFKQINRLFKKEIGTTVYNYLMTKKMKTAKILLEDTEMSIDEISYFIGYADSHNFSTLFKRKTGVTPTEYRKKNPSRQRSD
ncbi:AraC family transcriptional regulator [Paenibacillus solanacearum]|nr:AraC family transcriptional regulator [Paenibacillus solanacearum]